MTTASTSARPTYTECRTRLEAARSAAIRLSGRDGFAARRLLEGISYELFRMNSPRGAAHGLDQLEALIARG